MIKVRLFTFNKKENSTARPGSASVEYSCLVKSGSGIVNPSLEISTKDNVSKWNYAHIPDWSRYYFIREWTYDNGQWIASLDCDVLASWKDYIGASTQYVARSSATYDPYVMDTYYPIKTVADIQRHQFSGAALSTDMLTVDSTGAYKPFVVGVINNDSSDAAGAVSLYAMDSADLGTMKQMLMTDNGWIGNVDTGEASAVEISQSKVDINPYQYIASCRWFPMNVPHRLLPTSPIRCGWWAAPFRGYRYMGISPTRSWTLTTPRHPQSASRGMYLNNKSHSSYILDFAGFHFELDANMVAQTNNLRVDLTTDFIGGQSTCKVIGLEEGGMTQYLIAEQTQNLSVNIPIGQITFSSEGIGNVPVIGGIMDMAAHAGNWIAGGISGNHFNTAGPTERAIGAGLGLNKITSSFSAGSGGIAGITAHPIPELTCVFQFLSDEDRASAGRPVCRNLQIAGIPGFVMCAHVEIPLPATAAEQGAVKRLMEGGFFYE